MGQSPETESSSRVISTTLCCAEVDKDGRILRRFCVTMPGPYPLKKSGTTASTTPKAVGSQ